MWSNTEFRQSDTDSVWLFQSCKRGQYSPPGIMQEQAGDGSQTDAVLPRSGPGAELRPGRRAAAYRAACAHAPYPWTRGGTGYATVRADHKGRRTHGRGPDLARGSAQYPGARAPGRGAGAARRPGVFGAP